MKNVLTWMMVALTASFAAESLHAQAGSWRVIGSANWLDATGEPGESNEVPPVGTAELRSEFDPGAGAGFAIAYFLNDHIALEARGSIVRSELHIGIRTSHDSVAVLDLGETNLFPLAAVLQYHIPTSDRVQFFVGAGAGYLIVSDIDTPGAVVGDRVEFDETLELVLNAGLNWHFDDDWGLNADARYVPIETDARAVFPGIQQTEPLHLEPLILSAGLSYRF